jgi:survival-of-motor-neuron-related-splicing factor 30
LRATTNFSQLETVQSSLQAEPDNAELQSLRTELEEVISLTETAIAELKPASAPAPKKPSPPPVKEKWSKENHPAYQAGYRKPSTPQESVEEVNQPATFSVNDTVLAKWISGDNSFYPARITSITGSTSKPVYIVTFKSYGTTETLTAKDIKAISNDSRKRKADGISGSSTPTLPTNSSVISAAADINPALANQARREPSKVSDGPIRPPKVPRKVKANKELEAGKSAWQNFSSKGKMGKVGKKESMFRTPEGVNARGKQNLPQFLVHTDSISWLHWLRSRDAQGPRSKSAYLSARRRRRLLIGGYGRRLWIKGEGES